MTTNINDQLIHHCIYGNLEEVKELIQQGADIHYDDDRPIVEASVYGNFKIVKYLIEQGVDIHTHNDIAFTNCCEYGWLDMVKYFVSKGADIHIYNDYGIWIAWCTKHNKVVEYLESLGCVLDKKSKEHNERYWEM
jgi:hypothetical protein